MTISDEWLPVSDEGFFNLIGTLERRTISPANDQFRFLPDQRHRNRGGNAHGGLVLSLFDQALGLTARQGKAERQHATIQLNVHFIRGIPLGKMIEIDTKVVRETSQLCFLEGKLSVEGEIAASAQGVWKIFPRK